MYLHFQTALFTSCATNCSWDWGSLKLLSLCLWMESNGFLALRAMNPHPGGSLGEEQGAGSIPTPLGRRGSHSRTHRAFAGMIPAPFGRRGNHSRIPQAVAGMIPARLGHHGYLPFQQGPADAGKVPARRRAEKSLLRVTAGALFWLGSGIIPAKRVGYQASGYEILTDPGVLPLREVPS